MNRTERIERAPGRIATTGLGDMPHDLAVEMDLYARGLGANDSFLMLSGGPQPQGFGASSNRPLERGDVIIATGSARVTLFICA